MGPFLYTWRKSLDFLSLRVCGGELVASPTSYEGIYASSVANSASILLVRNRKQLYVYLPRSLLFEPSQHNKKQDTRVIHIPRANSPGSRGDFRCTYVHTSYENNDRCTTKYHATKHTHTQHPFTSPPPNSTPASGYNQSPESNFPKGHQQALLSNPR